jgi:16S rRNA (adenine1518-N6/adenine1519-N6)-dimethyltransferase
MHRARKRFGQNFLQDDGIIYSIVALINPGPDMHVIEIGPGLGALTLPLLRNLDHLVEFRQSRRTEKMLDLYRRAIAR